MNTIINNNKEVKLFGINDIKLHRFYLAEPKKQTHCSGESKKAVIFIGKIEGEIGERVGRVYYFYQNKNFVTSSDMEYLLDNFEIREDVTQKCKLICDL